MTSAKGKYSSMTFYCFYFINLEENVCLPSSLLTKPNMRVYINSLPAALRLMLVTGGRAISDIFIMHLSSSLKREK